MSNDLMIGIDGQSQVMPHNAAGEAGIAARQAAWPARLAMKNPTDEERIAVWLADNPFADALIQALNRAPTDPLALKPNEALAPEALVAKIKDNLP